MSDKQIGNKNAQKGDECLRVTINIRATKHQLKKWARSAKSYGISRSQWIRNVLDREGGK